MLSVLTLEDLVQSSCSKVLTKSETEAFTRALNETASVQGMLRLSLALPIDPSIDRNLSALLRYSVVGLEVIVTR